MLNFIFFILTITIIIIANISSNNRKLMKFISISSSSLILVTSIFLLSLFDLNNSYFQLYSTIPFLKSEILNIEFYFALDGLSILFFVLSSFLIFLCIVFIQQEKYLKEYLLSLFLIHIILLVIFSVLDLFLFYIFFEALLIPMYLLIGIWGSRERKVRAAYLLFFYTVCGSLLFLIAILYIYTKTGTFNYEYILTYQFTTNEQLLLWLGFFISFASKIPMFPFHIWLPEAHVEAPTVGSVLLAGILLKLGVYGFLRYSLVLFSEASIFFTPLVYTLSIIGIIYASLNAIRQTDLKRIIAYSSIAHMNLIVLGLFSFNLISLEGAIVQSISHGFVSGALFLLVGVIYDRYHTRLLFYYGGLVHTMPLYSSLLLLFTMANIALPGTSSFIGEFTLLLGIFKNSMFTSIISAVSVVLSGAYSLWLYNRIIFGNLKINYTIKYNDLNLCEFLILIPLAFIVIFIGIYPNYILKFIVLSSVSELNIYNYEFM
jgi:NADH-quinone oxidoreductase subunit M